jgi:hypothetical protein
MNQALDRRVLIIMSLALGNVLEFQPEMFVELANSIGDEHKSNMVQTPLFLLFIHYLFLDGLKLTHTIKSNY